MAKGIKHDMPNWETYRSWLIKSHQIINPGYQIAVNHYSQQKENFLKLLDENIAYKGKNFIEELNEEIQKESNEQIDKSAEELYEKIDEEFLNSDLANAIRGDKDLANKYSQATQKHTDRKSIYNSMKLSLEKFLAKQFGVETKQALMEKIGKTINNQLGNSKDVQQNLLGYIRQMSLQTLALSQGSDFPIYFNSFKNALRGYIKETVTTDGFNNLMRKHFDSYSPVPIIAITTGYLNAKEDVTLYMPQTVQTEISGLYDIELKPIGGIQSKSWSFPWDDKNYTFSMLNLGEKASLLPKNEEDLYYWHAGLYNVMNNLIEAIGDKNFIFGTGNKIYWTASMLNKMKKEKYVFAFTKYTSGKNGDKLTPMIVATPHTDK